MEGSGSVILTILTLYGMHNEMNGKSAELERGRSGLQTPTRQAIHSVMLIKMSYKMNHFRDYSVYLCM